MKSSIKFVRGLCELLLSCVVILGITSCQPPGAGVPPQNPVNNYLPAVDAIPDQFIGTWEATNYAGDIYQISKSKISSTYMEMNVVSDTVITTSEGYTIVFCQVPQGKGSTYTPDGYLYATAFKVNGANIDFCFQLDSQSIFKSVADLKAKYNSEYKIGANFFATYKKISTNSSAKQPVTLTDSTGYMTQIKFEENKVTLLMMNASGWGEYDSFTPKKETKSGTSLYLYSEADRSLVGDLHYLQINNDGSIYWYLYDDDEEDNDSTIEFCEDFMPEVSSDDLA